MHTVLKNDIFCRIAVQDQTPGFIGAGVQKAAFYVNYLLFTNTNINNMKHTLLIAVTAYWLVLFLPLKILVHDLFAINLIFFHTRQNLSQLLPGLQQPRNLPEITSSSRTPDQSHEQFGLGTGLQHLSAQRKGENESTTR